MSHARESFRVDFPGGSGHSLAGIVDRPLGAAEAPLVLFSHCFTCNKDLKAIVRISRRLAELGIGVLRYDMTGLGGSGGDFSKTNFTTQLADLHAAARFTAGELGPVRALIGHSFGGAVSMAAAAEPSGPLERLAGVATLAAPSDTVHLAELLGRMDPRIEREGQGVVEIGGRKWTIRRQMLDDFRAIDLPQRIAALTLPLLLFHSPQDETVGYEHALRIMRLAASIDPAAEASPAAPVSLVTLAGADHLLVRHAGDLAMIAETLAPWLRRYAAHDQWPLPQRVRASRGSSPLPEPSP